MNKLRNTLTIGVVAIGAIGAAAAFYVVHQTSPEAARSLLAVEAGTLAALGVVVWVLLGPTLQRLDDLVEALRALARGDKHARVDPTIFAGLADVARAVNEVGASLCENDDPNLGPIQKRTREKPTEIHKVKKSRTDPPSTPPQDIPALPALTTTSADPPAVVPRAEAVELSDHPEIGAVRVRKKDKKADKANKTDPRGQSLNARNAQDAQNAKLEPKPESQAPVPAVAAAVDAARPASEKPVVVEQKAPSEKPAEASAPTAPTASPPPTPPPTASSSASSATQSSASTPSTPSAPPAKKSSGLPAVGNDDPDNDTVIEPAEPEPMLPGRLELQQLFSEFVREKRAAGYEDVDVDFDAFSDTILGESERLVEEHGCRGVRFEVAVADGDVSLRPRLLR